MQRYTCKAAIPSTEESVRLFSYGQTTRIDDLKIFTLRMLQKDDNTAIARHLQHSLAA